MKKYTLFFTFFLFQSLTLLAQELSVSSATGRGGVATTFVTDYQAIGINPANVGYRADFRAPNFTFGAIEGNFNFFGEALSRKDVFRSYFRPDDIEFSQEEKIAAARSLAGSAVALDMSLMIFGASYSDEKLGGFAFSIRDNISFYTELNETATEIAFLGHNSSYFTNLLLTDGRIIRNSPDLDPDLRAQTIVGFVGTDSASVYSEVLDGSQVKMNWFREFNFSYGRKLFSSYDVSVYGGVGIKFLRGIALIDLEAKNGELTSSNISMSPSFGLDFGAANDTTSVNSPTFQGFQDGKSAISKLLGAKPVGNGFGADVGIHIVVKKNLHIGASVTNIGSMTWDGNVYQLNDGELVEISGAGYDNYNFFRSASNALQFAGTQSPLEWQGSREVTIDLPTTARLGISYEFFKTAHIGADVVIPLKDTPGSLENNLIAIGVDFRLNRNFKVSTGFNTGGNSQGAINLPMGITYTEPRNFFELGIATKDISSYIADFGDGSTVSLAVGFIRFKFNRRFDR